MKNATLFLVNSIHTRLILKNVFFILLFNIFLVINGYGQELGTLEFCRRGYSYIPVNIPDGDYTCTFYPINGGSFTENVEIKNGVLNIHLNLPTSLYSGWGTLHNINNPPILFDFEFSVISCGDVLVYDESCSKYVNQFPDLQNDSILVKIVCVGDTTEFFVKNSDINNPLPNLPFEVQRIYFFYYYGKIVSYDSISFKVVWEKPGIETMLFGSKENPAQYGYNYNESYYFFIKDTSSIIIHNLNNSNEICTNETLNIKLETNNEINPIWEISDGRVLRGIQNEITFNKAGDYSIKIFDDNDCSCTKPIYYDVKVNQGTAPKIVCKRTVCLGETVTYYSNDECQNYIWQVSSEGTIVEGGGIKDYYITVKWNNGPIGEVSLSTPNCIPNACKEETKETIYIITPTLSIDGKDTACVQSIYQYTVPDFTGTNFHWAVTSNGRILKGQNTNSVQVEWVDNVTGKVSVEYENCNTHCTGKAEKEIAILSKYEIYKGYKFCHNTNLHLSATSLSNWQIHYPSGTIDYQYSSDDIYFLANQIGKYKVIATNVLNNTCNSSDETSFEIKEDPPSPTDIEGLDFVCVNHPSNYTIPNLTSTQNVRWIIKDGSINDVLKGKNIEYTWRSSGPYNIKAVVIEEFTQCESLPFIKEFKNNVIISGSDTVCVNSTETYKIDYRDGFPFILNMVSNSDYTILNSEPDSITILWKKAGNYAISVDVCNTNVIMNIVVVNNPTFNLLFTDTICYNSSTILNTAINNGELFTLRKNDSSEDIILPITIDPGKYSITHVDINGCEYYERFEVIQRDKIELPLSLHNVHRDCMPFDPYYIEVDGGSGIYTYQWYKNSLPLSITSPSLYANDFGSYYVIVSDIHGCNSISDSLIIKEYCPTLTHGEFPVNAKPLIPKISGCGNITFELVPPFDTTKYYWYIDGELVSTDIKFEKKFDKAGTFKVIVSKCEVTFDDKGNGTCTCTTAEFEIIIPFIPEYEFKPGCVNTATTFINKTEALYPNTIKYLWNFDDPDSGIDSISTLKNPSHIYTKPGIYFVTLIATDTSGCAINVTKEIEIYPELILDFTSNNSFCLGTDMFFSVHNPSAKYKYEWDFGDKNSFEENYSTAFNTSHRFSLLGNFIVTLSAADERGCDYTISKSIPVVTNDNPVSIIPSNQYEKCPGDTITLKVSSPFASYKWSTGDTTPTINVVKAGIYKLTVYDVAGCSKEAQSTVIKNNSIVNTRIFSQDKDEFKKIHFDSLIICQGDSFDLKCTPVINGKYKWSNGYTLGNVLAYESYFKNLNPGRYEYWVEAEDLNCNHTTDKFIVIVNPNPDKPQIISNTNNCENQETKLSISNYDATHIYKWNNGDTHYETTVSSSGKYSVNVTNEYGCKILSDEIIIHPIPIINGWLTGCMDVCFPKEFCLNLPSENSYYLILDGINKGIFDISGGVHQFNEPGDYQIEAYNVYGCKTKTDILTLTAIPQDQSLFGIVYLDKDNNNNFDSSDVLIKNAILWLMNGNTKIDEVKTDDNGSYIFDSLTQNNLKVLLDASSVSFDVKHSWDSLLIYNSCIEDKEINFPLIINCIASSEDKYFSVCKGQSIDYNGKKYYAGDVDSVIYINQQGCDSIININIVEYPESEIELDLQSSCMGTGNGSAKITSINGESLMYGLTLNTLSNNNTFDNLDKGTHLIYYSNQYGCVDSVEFFINEIIPPTIELISKPTCKNQDQGILEIFSSNINLTFRIDSMGDFVGHNLFEKLNEGKHTLYYKDEDNCEYTKEFDITKYPYPLFNLDFKNSCFDKNTGAVIIEDSAIDNLQYSLDNNENYTTVDTIVKLSNGNHILYVKDKNNCIDSIDFTIGKVIKPVLDFSIKNTCINEAIGSIEIAASSEIGIALDGNDYSFKNSFKNLKPGNYHLSIKTEEECIIDTTFSILSLPIPQITAISLNTCNHKNSGEIMVKSLSKDAEVTMDGVNWFKEFTSFNNLAAGTYTLIVRDTNSCTSEITQIIDTYPILDIDIPEYNLDCYDEAITIKPIVKSSYGQVSYRWNDGSTEAEKLATKSGNYEVTISDKCDTRNFKLDLTIDLFNESEVLSMANIFYPGSKVGNECFRPILKDKFEILDYQFSIFDRWGNLVFRTIDKTACWDGLLKNKNAEQDVYVFIVDVLVKRCTGHTRIKKIGDVTLVR